MSFDASNFYVNVGETMHGTVYMLCLVCRRCRRSIGPDGGTKDTHGARGWENAADLGELVRKAQRHRCRPVKPADQ